LDQVVSWFRERDARNVAIGQDPSSERVTRYGLKLSEGTRALKLLQRGRGR
jgi:hypothetical protein